MVLSSYLRLDTGYDMDASSNIALMDVSEPALVLGKWQQSES